RIINAGETCSFNSTGAMVGSSHMEKLLHYENGILSMLGVRYIFDSSGLLTEDNSFHIETGEEFNVLEVYDIEVDFSEEQSIGIWGTPIDIEANSTYTIDLVVESSSEEGSIVIDFYGGSTYDSNEQQAMVIVEQGENHFSFRLSSGDTSLSEGEPQIRVFCCDGSLDRIVSLSVNKIEAVTIEYTLVSTEEGTAPIYENPEVNSILYTPSAVEHVDSFSDMFNSLINYDFKDTAYVEEDLNMFINQSDITFSDVNFTNNQIVAEVSAQSDGFVMFSQSYFPGWRAYIDGEEVELYCVSGTIMGAKVPEGDHEIKFTYIPTYTILGGIVTVGTYVALILGGIVVRRKRITENKTI
nr:YfhO family protein [Saccharofermentans sp.]